MIFALAYAVEHFFESVESKLHSSNINFMLNPVNYIFKLNREMLQSSLLFPTFGIN